MLLTPVAGQLRKERIVIVSDGALQYIPFAALPVRAAARGLAAETLLTRHEVVVLPSASVLAVIRQAEETRRPVRKLAVIFSDPVFDANDARVRQTLATVKIRPLPREIEEGVRGSDSPGFERLPFSRREADFIERLAPAGQIRKVVDIAANRSNATNEDVGQFRIIHFATHSVVDNRKPERSGMVLSLVDNRGQRQDGFLRLHEIYNLKLGADLVVLSACQTALGKEMRGEGPLSLTRGFMYAGVPRVVASLWDVKDEATAELMKRFYRGMLRDQLRPAAALRAALLSISKEKRWESPYYWAGFEIQGEWR